MVDGEKKAPDPLFFDKHGRVHSEIVKKMTAATRDIHLPEAMYGFHHRHIPLEKDKLLGLMMKRDTVIAVRSNGSFQGYLQSGDIITHIDKKPAPSDHTAIFKMITSKIPGKVHVSLARFKCRVTNQPKAGKFEDPSFHFEYKMLYLMRGMKLGLDTRDVENACFVFQILPHSIAAMGLNIGERIVEIETTLITTAAACRAKLESTLKKQGYARICVGVPSNDPLKNFIRVRLNALMPPTSLPLNIETPKELRSMAEMGIKTLKTLKAEPKSIFKKTSVLKQKTRSQAHISFNNVVNWYGVVVAESTPRLMVKVPSAKAKDSGSTTTTATTQSNTQESATEKKAAHPPAAHEVKTAQETPKTPQPTAKHPPNKTSHNQKRPHQKGAHKTTPKKKGK